METASLTDISVAISQLPGAQCGNVVFVKKFGNALIYV